MTSAESRFFKPKRLQLIPCLVFLLACCAYGVRMIAGGNDWGWVVAVGFGLGAGALGFVLLPNSSFLRLDPEGFTIRANFRERVYRWKDIDAFAVVPFGMFKLVAFSGANAFAASGHPRLGGALPDTYGMRAEDLATTLEEWRVRARRA
jgi:hypothetical protein